MGSIRRECLDHVKVWNERSLRRTLQNGFASFVRITIFSSKIFHFVNSSWCSKGVIRAQSVTHEVFAHHNYVGTIYRT